MKMSRLEDVVRGVVENDNCTGCGGCSLISDRIDMSLDSSGFSRPQVAAATDATADSSEARVFSRVCPGVRLTAPRAETGRELRTLRLSVARARSRS
jgi:coenzyme F420 hydrogenase subunit beta